MSRRIKYRAQCYYCKQWFDEGKAFLQRVAGRWLCQCDACYNERKERGK